MTRQEAIDELYKHYVPEYVNYIVTALTDGATPSDAPTINAIPIPDYATNGDVIKAMFPNAEVYVQEWKDFKSIVVWFENAQVSHDFTWDWWNAPYKGVLE